MFSNSFAPRLGIGRYIHALTIPIQSRDEIDFLSETLTQMVGQRSKLLADLETRVAERTQDLSSLFAVLAIATREQNFQVLLYSSLARTTEAMQADAGAILLVKENKSKADPIRLRLMALQGRSFCFSCDLNGDHHDSVSMQAADQAD